MMAENSNKIGEAIETAIKNELGANVNVKLNIEGTEQVASLNDQIGTLGNSFYKIGLSTQNLSKAFKGSMGEMDGSMQTVMQGVDTFGQNMSNLGNAFNATATIGQLFSIGGAAGVAGLAVTALVGIFSFAAADAQKKAEEMAANMQAPFTEMGNIYSQTASAASTFYNSIASASNVLEGVNANIVLSTDSYASLGEEMDTIQNSITQTIQNAKENRTTLNQEEVASVEAKFARMQELNQQEIEMEQSYADAVRIEAETLATVHAGSAEEYEEYAKKVMNSAQQTKDQIIAKAEEQYTEELLLKQKMIGTSDEYTQAWYESEVEAMREQKQKKIDEANAQCGETLSIVAQGYIDQNEELKSHLERAGELNEEAIAEEYWYSQQKKQLEDEKLKNTQLTGMDEEAFLRDITNRQETLEKEHADKMKTIGDEMTSNMDEKTANMAGNWMAMLADAELYGGDISDESKSLRDGFLLNLDDMPPESRSAFQNAMGPMLEEMKLAQPILFAKADEIATGIIYRFRRAFDEHSPSRKTRSVFQYLMKGAELGLSDEEGSLLKQADQISKNVLKQFDLDKANNLSNLYARMKQETELQAGRLSAAIGVTANGSLTAASASAAGADTGLIPASGKIKTVLNIDGREFAVATANYMSEELAWRNL